MTRNWLRCHRRPSWRSRPCTWPSHEDNRRASAASVSGARIEFVQRHGTRSRGSKAHHSPLSGEDSADRRCQAPVAAADVAEFSGARDSVRRILRTPPDAYPVSAPQDERRPWLSRMADVLHVNASEEGAAACQLQSCHEPSSIAETRLSDSPSRFRHPASPSRDPLCGCGLLGGALLPSPRHRIPSATPSNAAPRSRGEASALAHVTAPSTSPPSA